MTNRYAGMNGSFSAQIQAFADQAKEAIDATLRDIIINVGNSVITMSPVGRPEIWKINKISHEYNQAVAEHNSKLRDDPANITKTGRLKPGRKLNDGMGIWAPKGYVGGRFRGNWMFSINTPDNSTTEEVDPSGDRSRARIQNGVIEFKAGDTAYITNSLPYAIALEWGHSTQVPPSGMVRMTISRFQQIVLEAVEANKA